MASAALAAKGAEAEKLMKKANKFWSASILDFRLKPDWESAAPLYERAGLGYKQSGQFDKAIFAYEKAAMSQEKLGSLWHAAKHLETCGDLAKQLALWQQVAEFFRRAAQAYGEAGRASTGAEALARGAKMLDDKDPTVASQMYDEALSMFEDENKANQGADVFRAAVALLVRTQKWPDAAGMLMRFGEACDAANARNSQGKAYLGAITVWLYAQDMANAWQTFQDALAVPNFASSDEAMAADQLFVAYKSASVDAVKNVVQNKGSFKYMDSAPARLAVKLPQGDFEKQARQVAELMGAGDKSDGEEEEDEDLT